MNKSEYISRMEDILNDSSKFCNVDQDTTMDRLVKFQRWLNSHKFLFSDHEYEELYPSSASIPILYGLPKIHKPGTPLRPILSMVGSFNHSLARYLCKLLTPLQSAPSICKDSFSLSKYIRSSDLHKAYLVSFDIQSLFTNIPVDETIDIILNKLFPSKLPGCAKNYTYKGFKRLDFKRALEWCLKDNTFIFNGKFYIQTDGIAMGSPLAPILADIFLNHVLESHICKNRRTENNVIFRDFNDKFSNFKLLLFVRYVDDILAAFENSESVENFKQYMNSLHPNLKFTTDPEVDNSIAFLDIRITKTEKCVKTSVYRKTTHSGVYTHFSSFVPFKFKRQLLMTLLYRAYELCSDFELLHCEYERLRVMFMNNGYNRDLIYSFIKEFMLKKYEIVHKVSTVKPKDIFLKLPYLQDASYKVQKSINSVLGYIKCGDVNVKLFYKYFRLSDRLRFKDKSTLRSNCVYHIKCVQCNATYVGETSRNLSTRMVEHGTPSSSQNSSVVSKHLFDNPNHSFNVGNPDVLCYESNSMKRKVKEALFIQELKPTLNKQEFSYKLFLFDVPKY